MKGPAMEFGNGPGSYCCQIFDLFTRLGNRFARMTHFPYELLSNFGIFAQPFCGLFENVQYLTDAALLFPLHVCECPDTFATHSQVIDDGLKLTAKRPILLTFRAVDNIL